MTIREAHGDDLDDIKRLSRGFLASTMYGQLFPDVTDIHLSQLVTAICGNGTIFLAVAGRRAIGMLAVVASVHQLGGAVVAEEVAWYVEPGERHRRAGPLLLAAATEWATTQGAKMLRMVAPAGSEVGRFYERKGFRAVETSYVRLLR